MPYDNFQSSVNQVLEDEYEDNNGSKKITRSCRHLRVNGNQELLQYFTRAMTEWTSGSSNKFCNDVVKDNHRGIWARRSILVQIICCDGLQGQECHLQSTDRHYPMEINAWRKEGCVLISSIGVQGLGSSQLGTKREGKHTPRAMGAIHLGFEPNTSVYSFFIPERNTMMSSNQAQFDETVFPFRNKEMIEKCQSDGL
jgi:hypothetical protein